MPAPVWPPVAKLHKPSGLARVRYRGHEEYLGRWGSSEAALAYADFLRRMAAEYGHALDGPGPSPGRPRPAPDTVAVVVAEWRAIERPKYDVEGQAPRMYDTALGVLLARFGTLPAADFTVARLRALRDEDMVARGWARVTINRHVVRLQTVWRWAEERDLVPRGSWGNLRTLRPVPRGDRRVPDYPPVRPMEAAHVELLLLGCHPLLAAMVEVQWLTGMRTKEVRTMRVGEVDTTAWEYRPTRHKNTWRGHDRVVPLGPRVRAILAPYLEGKGAEEWVFPASRSNRRNARRVVRRGPKCYSAEGHAQAFARACEAAGLLPDDWCPYSLRHGRKQAVEREHGLDAARTVLGQSSLEATSRYAAGRDADTARRLADEDG